mmetsp:Transcript_9203/g.17387  ORF Transcript_9203/g.17387 Transcript_9203/m.17387 type:complete len:539 (-) Transcript_9203:33-1649(-)
MDTSNRKSKLQRFSISFRKAKKKLEDNDNEDQVCFVRRSTTLETCSSPSARSDGGLYFGDDYSLGTGDTPKQSKKNMTRPISDKRIENKMSALKTELAICLKVQKSNEADIDALKKSTSDLVAQNDSLRALLDKQQSTRVNGIQINVPQLLVCTCISMCTSTLLIASQPVQATDTLPSMLVITSLGAIVIWTTYFINSTKKTEPRQVQEPKPVLTEEAQVKRFPSMKNLGTLTEDVPSRKRRSSTRKNMSVEFGFSSDAWLNFFAGMNAELEKQPMYARLQPQQKQIFKDFRKDFRNKLGSSTRIDRMKTYTLPDDFSMLRYLQANDFDPNVATVRLLSTVVWRQTIDLDSVVASPPKQLEQYRKLRVRQVMGVDRFNRIVVAERLGEFISAINTPLGRTIAHDDILKCYIYDTGIVIKKLREIYEERGHLGWSGVYIIDLKGTGFFSAMKCLPLFKLFAKQVDAHYPEMAGKIIIINFPSALLNLYKIVKQFLDPVVVSKLQFHSGIPTDKILEFMDESEIYREYGGTNDAPFPHAI